MYGYTPGHSPNIQNPPRSRAAHPRGDSESPWRAARVTGELVGPQKALRDIAWRTPIYSAHVACLPYALCHARHMRAEARTRASRELRHSDFVADLESVTVGTAGTSFAPRNLRSPAHSRPRVLALLWRRFCCRCGRVLALLCRWFCCRVPALLRHIARLGG